MFVSISALCSICNKTSKLMSLFYVMHLLQDIIRPTFAGLFHVVYAYNHFLDSVLFGAAYVHKIKFFATTG